MKKKIYLMVFFIFSFAAMADSLELTPPIEGAQSYEILLFSHATKKDYTFSLKTTEIKTDKIPAGDYDYQIRYANDKGEWSEWSDKAVLKIKKRKSGSGSDFYFPAALSVGYTTLAVDLKSNGGRVKNTENLLTGRFNISKDSYKLRFKYNTNSNFSRLDMALVKDIYSNFSAGASFWMVNYSTKASSGEAIMANLSQGFAEANYFYDWRKLSFLLRGGVSLGLNYFVKPELSIGLPFLEKYNPAIGFAYEWSRIDQSNIVYNLNGSGYVISSNISVSF